jgi:hypothetical protein
MAFYVETSQSRRPQAEPAMALVERSVPTFHASLQISQRLIDLRQATRVTFSWQAIETKMKRARAVKVRLTTDSQICSHPSEIKFIVRQPAASDVKRPQKR